MEGLVEFAFGLGGALIGAGLVVLLLGAYFMWRSSRKLGEMT